MSFDKPSVSEAKQTASEIIDSTVKYDMAAPGALQPYTLVEVAHIFTELANAIDYAHSRNMVHHDLKPANIMFTAEGQVVLTDFGIVRILGVDYTAQDLISGTPAYMSPEQCQGYREDPRSDIYALGVILYEVVTGQKPFEADNVYGYIKQHIEATPLPPSSIKPGLPDAVEKVILTALSKDPNNRYQTAGDMIAALRTGIGLSADLSNIPYPSYSPIEWSVLESPPTRDLEVPFQAPRDVVHFVGREELLEKISEIITQPTSQNFFCLTGMGGIGKTALVTRLAHVLKDRFPDGILWANLASSEPFAILDSWAKAYGFDFSTLPDIASRAASLRGELANKKTLIVLDDVWNVSQVQPLLPSGPDNIVLITTRDQDLPLALDAEAFPLSVLGIPESRQLMTYIIGEKRVQAESAIADEICRLLGHLPLAVRIAARLLLSRRRWKLVDLAARLRDESNRLATLKIRDREVRASFTVSWDLLDEELRRTFALIAVFEGRPFRVSALTTVAEVDRTTAEDHLYSLVSLSLVAEASDTHYQQHPLLADYAREHLDQPEEAYSRMSRYYLAFATRYQHNYALLEQEWESLLAAMRIAHQQKRWARVIEFTNVLTQAWFAQGRFSDARKGYGWAREAAETIEDRLALEASLRGWGQACIEQSDYDEAEKHLLESLEISEGLKIQTSIASAKYYLGRIAVERANYDEAQRLLKESQLIREELGDMSGVAETLYQQAIMLFYRDYQKSKKLLKQALEIQQSTGDKQGSIRTLRWLAETILLDDKGDRTLAEKFCQQALELCEEIDEQGELGPIYFTLSEIYKQQDKFQAARENIEKSLTLFRRMGDRKSVAKALYRLSQVNAELEEYETALQEGVNSLDLCRELQDIWGTIHVLRYLGDLHHTLDQGKQARERWEEALAIARKLQHPFMNSLQERLDPN